MNDELDVVRRLGAGEAVADPAARERVRGRVLGRAPVAPRRSRWRNALVAVPAVAVAMGVALVLVLAPSDRDGGFSGSGPLRPAVAPELFPAPGQFLYVRSVGRFLVCREGGREPSCRLGDERTREVWVSDRRSGRLSESPGRSMRLGRVPLQIGNRSFTRAQLARYRPSARELLADLRRGRARGQGDGGATYPFTQLTDALREVPMPADVRRAIVEALPLVPGVEGGFRGRVLRYSRVVEGQREEVVIDPRTLTMREERTVVVDPRAGGGGFTRGDVIGRAVYLERAVVDRVGERP